MANGDRKRAVPSFPPRSRLDQQTAKRRRIERDFRWARGHAVSEHGSDGSLESDSDATSGSSHSGTITDEEESEGEQVNEEDEEDEEAAEWENVLGTGTSTSTPTSKPMPSDSLRSQAEDLILTLDAEYQPQVDPNKKKGVSARERKERLWTHIVHVICLLYHGYVRNYWLGDEEIQSSLRGIIKSTSAAKAAKTYLAATRPTISPPGSALKRPRTRQKAAPESSQTLNAPVTPKGNGDPRLIEILGGLMRFWKQRFRTVAPGLRKRGYQDQETRPQDARYPDSEIIKDLSAFREKAKQCEGSRDVGAQLFTALLRGLGFEARLVFSLCPLGYGFTKAETQDEQISADSVAQPRGTATRNGGIGFEHSDMSGSDSENETQPSAAGSFDHTKPRRLVYDKDLKFPTFWTEVYSPISEQWLAIDPFATGMVLGRADDMSKLEPKGRDATRTKQQISYVIAYNMNYTAKDVTIRYLTKRIFPGKTKGFRMPCIDRQILSKQGEVLHSGKFDLFSEQIMKCFQLRPSFVTMRDLKEDQELLPPPPARPESLPAPKNQTAFPVTVAAYKNHPLYVLESHLKREECIMPDTLPMHTFETGKAEKAKTIEVFPRSSVVHTKGVENWYKEGRVIRAGEQPLKLVPSRAVTINRKRAIEDAKREGDDEAGLQGLYGFHQTILFMPPAIQNGKIPKNGYGNIDCFVPSMIPVGATHVPLRNATRLCKKLGFEFAEAVTGFEFKNKRAIPRTEGVLCCTENADVLIAACNEDEEEKRRKENGKRQQLCLGLWKRFLMGLRIVERIEGEYGDDEVILGTSTSPPAKQISDKGILTSDLSVGDDIVAEEGGFIRDGMEDIGGDPRNSGTPFNLSENTPTAKSMAGPDSLQHGNAQVLDGQVMSLDVHHTGELSSKEGIESKDTASKTSWPSRSPASGNSCARSRRGRQSITGVKSKYFTG